MKYPTEIAVAVTLANFERALNWQTRPPELCGCAIVHLTARARLDLEISGNGLVANRPASAHDLFALLWRLHPHYVPAIRPRFLRLKQSIGLVKFCRLVLAFGNPLTAARYNGLRRHVATLDRAPAIAAAAQYCQGVYRDRFAIVSDDTEPERMRLKPPPVAHWFDSLAAFFLSRFSGWSRDALLDAPLVQLYQLARAWCIANGVTVIDEEVEAAASDFVDRQFAANETAIRLAHHDAAEVARN